MADARSPDPLFPAHFRVELDETPLGAFTEVSGLAVEMELEEVVEGGQFVQKLPGRLTWPNLVLKRGVTDNRRLLEWFEEASADVAVGRPTTLRSLTLVALGPDGEEVREWTFHGAVPTRWTGPTLAAGAGDLAVEELEVAHHGTRTP